MRGTFPTPHPHGRHRRLAAVKQCKGKALPYLDLVRVHGCVRNENLGVLNALWLVDTNLFVKQKAFLEVRVAELAAELLDNLNGLKVARLFDPERCVDGKVGEVLLGLCQDLGAQRRARNVVEIVTESLSVRAVFFF